jgi:hypothetical protein
MGLNAVPLRAARVRRGHGAVLDACSSTVK